MERLIKFLCNEFPDDALEIQECIDLLNQSISGTVNSIKKELDREFERRNFEKMRLLTDFLSMIDDIQNKLDYYSNALEPDDEIKETIVEKDNKEIDDIEKSDYDSYSVDPNIPYTLYDNCTYKRPAGFEIFGKRYEVRSWKDVFVQTCKILASKDMDLFSSFIDDDSINGRKARYFCKDPNLIRSPTKVPGTDIYVITNMSANQIRNTIQKMLAKFGIRISDYKVFLRADYTARHE